MTSQSNHPSTTSLESATTLVSSTPSNTLLQPRPQKDYAAALGTLQSRYGTGGLTPSPKAEASDKLPAQNTGSSSSTSSNVAPGSISSSMSSLSLNSTTGNQKDKGSKDKKSLFRSLLKGKGKGKEREKEKAKDSDSSKPQS